MIVVHVNEAGKIIKRSKKFSDTKRAERSLNGRVRRAMRRGWIAESRRQGYAALWQGIETVFIFLQEDEIEIYFDLD